MKTICQAESPGERWSAVAISFAASFPPPLRATGVTDVGGGEERGGGLRHRDREGKEAAGWPILTSGSQAAVAF